MSSIIENGMYVSLKKDVYAVIEKDINLFRTCEKTKDNKYKFTLNKFLNTVFLNMYDGRKFAPSSVKRTRNIGAKSVNIKINKDIEDKINKILKPYNPYPSDFAAYYMLFIEEYCKMSLNKREEVFYKKLISELKDAIDLKYNLRVYKNDHKYPSNIFPYEIKTSDENSNIYLTGFKLYFDKDKRIYFYRNTLGIPLRKILSVERIQKIEPQKQIYFREKYPEADIQSYKDLEEYIQKRFATDGILYLSDILRDVTVRLSDTGIEYLYSRTQYKPFDISFDKEDIHIIHFKATKLQTFMYFFKFGGDAEILQPAEYRQNFIEQYEKALSIYKNVHII